MATASDFLLILVPHDDGGLEIEVKEYATARDQQEGLEEAVRTGWWRDVIGVYRHHGSGVLDNKWWGGPSTIYGRRFAKRAALDTGE